MSRCTKCRAPAAPVRRTSRPTNGSASFKPAGSTRWCWAKAIIGSERIQMPRHQIVGQVESFIEIRANHFCDAVLRSSTDDAVRHQLMTINKLHARLRSDQVFLGNNKTEPGVEIRDEIRRLSRSIMRSVLVRHRQPRFNHMNPGIDHRRVTVGAAVKALHAPHRTGIRGMRRSIGKNGKPTQTEVTFPAPLKA